MYPALEQTTGEKCGLAASAQCLGTIPHLHGDQLFEFGDRVAKSCLNSVLQGERGAGTAVARADETHLRRITDNFHQFDIAPVRVKGGTDVLQYGFHTLPEGIAFDLLR